MIALVSKWITSILQKAGDSPEQPYVLKAAFTGTAASNIGGGTLTSTFQLGFGNAHQCFRDKDRDKKKHELISHAVCGKRINRSKRHTFFIENCLNYN